MCVCVCVCVCVSGLCPDLQNSLFLFAKPEQLQCVCVCVSMMEEREGHNTTPGREEGG